MISFHVLFWSINASQPQQLPFHFPSDVWEMREIPLHFLHTSTSYPKNHHIQSKSKTHHPQFLQKYPIPKSPKIRALILFIIPNLCCCSSYTYTKKTKVIKRRTLQKKYATRTQWSDEKARDIGAWATIKIGESK